VLENKTKAIVCALTLGAVALLSPHQVLAQRQKLPTPEKLTDGILLGLGDSILKIEVCTDSVIHYGILWDNTSWTPSI
jgi:hypothetical protein